MSSTSGTLFASLHNLKNGENIIRYSNRYLQICMPDLKPFLVKIVPKIICDSVRGSGGIGSTGS